jgi:hypothetical protein
MYGPQGDNRPMPHLPIPLRAYYATLRQGLEFSREEFRRVSAAAEKLHSRSKALAKEWTEVVARTKELRALSKHNQQRLRSPQEQTITPDNAVVATARRVPWRRLQMEEVDGPIKIWIAPGYEEV